MGWVVVVNEQKLADRFYDAVLKINQDMDLVRLSGWRCHVVGHRVTHVPGLGVTHLPGLCRIHPLSLEGRGLG